jgi:hypothetical protein
MSNQEALDMVDLVVEKLHDMGVIPENNYGRFTEKQRHELADLVEEKSNE